MILSINTISSFASAERAWQPGSSLLPLLRSKPSPSSFTFSFPTITGERACLTAYLPATERRLSRTLHFLLRSRSPLPVSLPQLFFLAPSVPIHPPSSPPSILVVYFPLVDRHPPHFVHPTCSFHLPRVPHYLKSSPSMTRTQRRSNYRRASVEEGEDEDGLSPSSTTHGLRHNPTPIPGAVEMPLLHRDPRLPKIYYLPHGHKQLQGVSGVERVFVYFQDTNVDVLRSQYEEYNDMVFPDGTREGVEGAGTFPSLDIPFIALVYTLASCFVRQCVPGECTARL